LLQNWILLFTEFVPQLLLALMTVQFFEELGCAGFVQHRLQSRHGALNASFLVALAFAFLHLPTYLSAPISGAGALRDLSVMVIVSVRNLFPDPHDLRLQPHPVQRPHRLHHPRLLQRSVCNHLPKRDRRPQAQVLAFASVGLLALLAVVLTKGKLAYNRDHSPTAHQVA